MISLIEKEILIEEEKLFLNEMFIKYKVKSKLKNDLVYKMVVLLILFILG